MSQQQALLKELIQAGNDIQGNNYFSASILTLLLYDYLLTFGDEVRYAWRGRKTWIFYLFILNRYLPIMYKIWMVIEDYWPKYTILPIFFVWSTLVAQIFLMLRIYALSGKNKLTLAGFGSITIIQALTGILTTVILRSGVVQPPQIPLEVFQLCVYNAKVRYVIAYSSISILYDSVAFIFIICLSKGGVSKVSTTIRTIIKDSTVYFLVIFTSHIILTSFMIFAREDLKLTPAIASGMLIPLLVTRFILSLREATDPQMIAQWNLDHFTGMRTFTTATTTTTGGHPTPLGTQHSATRHALRTEIADSVLELSHMGSQEKRRHMAPDNGVQIY